MSETIKIIIAVMSVGFLIYLFVSLYGITTKKTEIEQARASLNQIILVINSLEEGEEKTHVVETREGENWLAYFTDNKLLCICLENNLKEECVDEGLGVCKETGYVFEMLTSAWTDTNVQYLELNELLVRVKITKSGDRINIVKSSVEKSQGSWEKFSSSKPEEVCPIFISEIEENVGGIYTEAYRVSEFNSIEELIIDLPEYWEEIKDTNFDFFDQRAKSFLSKCVKEFQEENELFAMGIIFSGLPISTEFVFNPTGVPLNQLSGEEYFETTLVSKGNKKIIIKIYPEELLK